MEDLDTALDACRDLAVVNVEIKNWPDDVDFDPSLAVVDRVVDALAARPAGERDRVLVSCFHLPSLDRVRERSPALATAWLVSGPVEATGQARVAPVGRPRQQHGRGRRPGCAGGPRARAGTRRQTTA